MTLNEYKEIQDLIIINEFKIDKINKEIKKLPKDYIENHLQKLYILGDDVLDYSNNAKNGKFRTWDAILIQRPFPFFRYKCSVRWGCAFRETWFKVDDVNLYNEKTNLSKLDRVSLEKLTVALTKVLNGLILENKRI